MALDAGAAPFIPPGEEEATQTNKGKKMAEMSGGDEVAEENRASSVEASLDRNVVRVRAEAKVKALLMLRTGDHDLNRAMGWHGKWVSPSRTKRYREGQAHRHETRSVSTLHDPRGVLRHICLARSGPDST